MYLHKPPSKDTNGAQTRVILVFKLLIKFEF